MPRRAGNEADETIRRRDDTTISSGAPGHYPRLPPPYRRLARDVGASATLMYTYIFRHRADSRLPAGTIDVTRSRPTGQPPRKDGRPVFRPD